jgi:uncharacterized protein (UPF0332 family)
MKIGIKCEIHDCTLGAAKLLLIIKHGFMKEIERAKEQRVNMQYYTDRTVSDEEYEKNIKSAPRFVIEMEKIASSLTKNDIQIIRDKMEKIIKSSAQSG